jgi:hypothetical protein
MTSHVQTILTIGIILSVVALLLVLVAVIDVWRRGAFPEISYGGITLSQKRLRWVWFLVLIGALIISTAEDPVVVQTTDQDHPELLEAAAATRQVTVTMPLPFYHYQRDRIYADDVLVSEHLSQGFQIPGSLLSALLAYLLLVVRWNPENRWALRILHGRRHRPEPAPEEAETPEA